MESLYRKLRPKVWEELVGNSENIQQLKKFVASEKRPHSYLFTGGSGCGKTTMARILANELGADDLSIQEVNIADSRGIDTMREIIEKMRFLPVNGKPRVYILDEFHRGTADAQSALLKPLEDTPTHVYFLLCTTDPQKVLKTIKTRCTQINVDFPDERELFKYLNKVIKQEELPVEKVVIPQIIENCEGSLRQALVLLEQAAQVDGEEGQIKAITNTSSDNAEVIALCRELLKPNPSWGAISEILKSLKEQKIESESIRYAVLGYMTSVLLSKGSGRAAGVMDCFLDHTYDSKFAGIVFMCHQACQ